MEQNPILQLLTDALGPMGPMIALAGLGAVMVIAVLPSMLKKRVDPLDKLRAAAQAQGGTGARLPKGQKLRHTVENDKLEKFAGFLEPKSQEEMSEARKWLQKAGYRSPNAVRTFHAVQFAMGLGLLALGGIYVMLANAGDGPKPSSTVTISRSDKALRTTKPLAAPPRMSTG